jgi:hypothetical protein
MDIYNCVLGSTLVLSMVWFRLSSNNLGWSEIEMVAKHQDAQAYAREMQLQ